VGRKFWRVEYDFDENIANTDLKKNWPNLLHFDGIYMVKNEATMLVLAVPIKKQVEHFDGAQVIPMDPSKSLQRFHQ